MIVVIPQLICCGITTKSEILCDRAALALACGETVLLAAYGARRGQMIVIDIIDAPHPLRWVVRLNQWNAIHSGATGLRGAGFLRDT
jgi:DNA-binding IclR family transcriptional regulator